MKPFVWFGGQWFVSPRDRDGHVYRMTTYPQTRVRGYDTQPEAVDAVYALFQEPA